MPFSPHWLWSSSKQFDILLIFACVITIHKMPNLFGYFQCFKSGYHINLSVMSTYFHLMCLKFITLDQICHFPWLQQNNFISNCSKDLWIIFIEVVILPLFQHKTIFCVPSFLFQKIDVQSPVYHVNTLWSSCPCKCIKRKKC